MNNNVDGSFKELELKYCLDSFYYLRDLEHIVRIMRKVAGLLTEQPYDYDWLKYHIEMFLVLNSRVYNDLLPLIIEDISKKYELPYEHRLAWKVFLIEHAMATLSYTYHVNKKIYRHAAAHRTVFYVAGIPEFNNNILPKPLNYKPTFKPPLFNMASISYITELWQSQINECADDIEKTVSSLSREFNQYKDKQKKESPSKLTKVQLEEVNAEIKGLIHAHTDIFKDSKPASEMTDKEIEEAMQKSRDINDKITEALDRYED